MLDKRLNPSDLRAQAALDSSDNRVVLQIVLQGGPEIVRTTRDRFGHAQVEGPFPSGRQTRAISFSAATGSGKVHVESEETTVSKLSSEKGRASASANKKETFIDSFAARFRAMFNISLLRSDRNDSASARIVGKVLPRPDGDLKDCAARALQHPLPQSCLVPSSSGMPSTQSYQRAKRSYLCDISR